MSHARDRLTFSKRFIVAATGTALLIALGAAAISSDQAGALEGSNLDDGSHLLSDARITPEEAIDIAQGEVNGNVEDIDLERNGSELIYDIEINDTDVHIDAMDGAVLYVEYEDDDDDVSESRSDDDARQDDSEAASKNTNAEKPAISTTEAIEIAEGEVGGNVEGVDLEQESGQLVYEVEINDTDVYVDAQDGTVVYVDHDDDDDDDRDSEADVESGSDAPEVSPEEAIAIAQDEVDGQVDDVELDREGGRLIYEIEVGNHDVEIDASDGSILKVEWDD
jgi:uncharacterized membrane protein YkoI